MTTFEVTRDEVVFAVGSPVSFDVVPVVASFTTGPPAGVDGTSFTPRGPWDSGATYAVGDVVSFSGANYILYASPPTGGDPDVDTAHWDTFGSGAGVSPSRSISTTAPLAGGGDLSADRTLTIADASTSVKGAVQLEDSVASTSTTKAATPKNVKQAYDLAAAAQPGDADLTAIAGATLTGDGYLKRASGAWSLDTPSGGGGGPDFDAPVTVTGDVGVTTLNGDDYLMETASDTGVQAPGATFARSRGDMGAKEAVQADDILAYPLYAQGHDGTSLVLAGQITAEVDGTVATGKVPTRIRIATADSDGVLTDRMIIGADGTTDVLGDFTVNGSPVSGGGGGGLEFVTAGTVSAASPAHIDDVFDTSATRWRVELWDFVASADNYLRGRVRAGGTDDSGTYSLAYSGTLASGTSGEDKFFAGGSNSTKAFIILEVTRPAEVVASVMMLQAAGAGFIQQVAITTPAHAFDGLTFYNDSSANLSFAWAVYKYQDS